LFPRIIPDAPILLEVTKTKASGKCKEFPSPWWRWREIKQTKIGQSARPGTYGNPKQRPEGGPIEKNNGKTGYTLRLAKVLTKPTQRGNNGDNGTYMMKE